MKVPFQLGATLARTAPPPPPINNAKMTILTSIFHLYRKYLSIQKFMSSISPVFNTAESVEPIRPKPDDRKNKNLMTEYYYQRIKKSKNFHFLN